MSEEDLAWRGKGLAAKILEPRPPASLSDSPDASVKESLYQNASIEADVDRVVADLGTARRSQNLAGNYLLGCLLTQKINMQVCCPACVGCLHQNLTGLDWVLVYS